MFYGQDVDNEPPVDPIYNEASGLTDLYLESIEDDIADMSDDAYNVLWQETYDSILARLKSEREDEIALDYPDACPTCEGNGYVVVGWDNDAYENIEGICPDCNGSGKESEAD